MNPEKIKRMIDACYQANRVRELLPPLPEGVTPAYIRYIDTIHKLRSGQERVKISDISDYLQLPRPGITRTVTEMVKKGYLTKKTSSVDGRITYVQVTKKGEALSEKYDTNYYNRLCPYLACISEEEADCMIETIGKLYNVMSERSVEIE